MDQVYQLKEKAEIIRKFEHAEFLAHIGLGEQQPESRKNIAIIGEPGAGKTTLLEKIAQVIHEALRPNPFLPKILSSLASHPIQKSPKPLLSASPPSFKPSI
jgi:hypothetical protein